MLHVLALLPPAALAQDDDGAPDHALLTERARAAASATPGCFAMTGTGIDKWAAGIFGSGENRWMLIDGLWNPLTATVAADSPDRPDDAERGSLFGHKDAEKADAGKEAFLDALKDEVGIEYVVRAGEGWNFVRTLKGGKGLNNTLTVTFDAAIQPRKWAIHIVDPIRLSNDDGSRAKIEWMDLTMQADEQGAPAYERIDGRFAQWPFWAEIHAETRWSARRCGS
jgi:hypothetical protein